MLDDLALKGICTHGQYCVLFRLCDPEIRSEDLPSNKPIKLRPQKTALFKRQRKKKKKPDPPKKERKYQISAIDRAYA